MTMGAALQIERLRANLPIRPYEIRLGGAKSPFPRAGNQAWSFRSMAKWPMNSP